MLNENAKQWVKALRSGKYKQGKYRLHTENNTFCCLGVACDLAVKNNIISKPSKQGIRYVYEMEVAGLPILVQNWLGLIDSMGGFFGGSLYELNDSQDKTFDQIADIIESEPKGLFKDN